MRQSVVQNAVNDMDIKFGFGVQGHQGMGVARWPLWGWMEFAIWSRDLRHSWTCARKCGAEGRLRCGHQIWFRSPRAPRDGPREVAPLGLDGVCHLEQGMGHPRTCAPKCGAKRLLWRGHQIWVLKSLGTKGWVSRGGPSRDGWSLPS